MAKLTSLICLGLLCVVLVSGRDLRGTGGSSSSSEEVTPIDKKEFEEKLGDFSKVFEAASSGVGEIETAALKAKSTQELGDWYAVLFKFGEVIERDLSKLEPAFDGLGRLLERIAESPDVFPPLPYCDSSAKLASGKTPITTNFEDARQIALVEDLGCFKNKILAISSIDFNAVKQPNYSELQAFKLYIDLLEEALQLEKAFERFFEALETLNEQSTGGASKRGEDGNADIAKLVRLLKQLNLGNRR